MGELTPAAAEKLFNLKLEMTELEREERLIDNHIKWLKQVKIQNHIIVFFPWHHKKRKRFFKSLKNVTEHVDNQRYSYIRHLDVGQLFEQERILAARAPPGTSIEVDPPRRVHY